MVLKVDLRNHECALKEQPQREFGELGLDQSTNRLVTELEYLLTFLVPLVVLEDVKQYGRLREILKVVKTQHRHSIGTSILLLIYFDVLANYPITSRVILILEKNCGFYFYSDLNF